MADNDPKTKDNEKIKFFKIDREGDIAPAFPPNDPNASPENTFARIEPVFAPAEDSPSAPLSGEPPPMWETPAPPAGEPWYAPEAPAPLTGAGAPAAPIKSPASQGDPLSLPLTFSSEREDLLERQELERPIPPPPGGDPQLEIHIDALKPQVDSISRLGERQDLTVDQVEVLRKYISLKEAEVRDLRDQQRQYQNFVKKITKQVENLSRRNRDLLTEVEQKKREESSARGELRGLKDRHAGEVVALKNEYEDRLRRSGNYDAQAEELYRKREEWKEKVREELKRIKLKERELENKHELLKRDMQALLDSKDKHVLELKKKNDAFELEMESLEDRLRRSNVVMAAIDSKKRRLVETMKLAITLLEGIDAIDRSDEDEKRKAG